MRDHCHKVRSRMWSRCLMMRAGTPAATLLPTVEDTAGSESQDAVRNNVL